MNRTLATASLGHPFEMIRQFDRALSGRSMFDTPTGFAGTSHDTGSFAVDVREEADTLVVEADLPGFDKSQIDVRVESGLLTIEADRSQVAPATELGPEGDAEQGPASDADSSEVPAQVEAATRPHIRERATRVSRRFRLPKAYDTAHVEAALEHGVLTLRLPKREDVKPRRIEIR